MGSVLSFARGIGDSLTNLVSRMGTERDKSSHSVYGAPVIDDAQIAAAYRGAWLPRKIVDIPALDSCRKWRNWQADEKAIEAIEAEEKRLHVRGKVLEARTKARLYGGAAILIGTGEADQSEELNLDRIGTGGIKYLTVLTRRQLSAQEIERDPASEWFGKPSRYAINGQNGQQVFIHPSRLVIFHGATVADDDLAFGVNMGWGDSVLLAVLDAIKNADSTAANIASLVFEAKIDVIRIPNFMAQIGQPGYEETLLKRYSLANTAKGINGTLLLDKEEEYETKTASFATLPDVLAQFLQITAGAADIPVTRLLGQSPAGLNSTGEADLRNYYDRISAMQEIEMTPAMFRLDEALIRSATGGRDEGIYYTWSPLWQMSDKEKAEIFKTKADAARVLAGNGGTAEPLLPIDALSDALVNTFIEDNSLPGLEAAIEEYGRLSEQEEEDPPTDLVPANANDPLEQQRQRMAANDAAPRTLYIQRKVKNAAAIIAWAKSQGFDTTLPADDLHVTIAYSRTPVDWMKVGESWSPELKVGPGGPRLMDQFGEATVLLFNANELRWRNEAVTEAGGSWDYPEYQPHITISYGFKGDLSKVQPYQGEIVLGPELFAEVKEDWAEGLKET